MKIHIMVIDDTDYVGKIKREEEQQMLPLRVRGFAN